MLIFQIHQFGCQSKGKACWIKKYKYVWYRTKINLPYSQPYLYDLFWKIWKLPAGDNGLHPLGTSKSFEIARHIQENIILVTPD